MKTSVVRRLVDDRRVRYLAAGGFSAVLYYAVFAAGWLALGRVVPYLVLAVVTGTLCAVVTYPVYRCLVFQTGGPVLAGFLRFYALCLWSLLFGIGGLWALVELAGLHVLLAQAVIMLLGPLINYQAGRLWAFRPTTADGRGTTPPSPPSPR
ncbi:GtrA family protein [Actinoplanes sp. NPDC049265]|uniref:GtrA family protein n=1 Tax=Actinoplanes sp. NPDC049265 TaxID=3363902 RepID=UPI003724463B